MGCNFCAERRNHGRAHLVLSKQRTCACVGVCLLPCFSSRQYCVIGGAPADKNARELCPKHTNPEATPLDAWSHQYALHGGVRWRPVGAVTPNRVEVGRGPSKLASGRSQVRKHHGTHRRMVEACGPQAKEAWPRRGAPGAKRDVRERITDRCSEGVWREGMAGAAAGLRPTSAAPPAGATGRRPAGPCANSWARAGRLRPHALQQ